MSASIVGMRCCSVPSSVAVADQIVRPADQKAGRSLRASPPGRIAGQLLAHKLGDTVDPR